MNTTKVANANPSGDADIQVFGSSRVKIFAEEFEDYQARGPLHYSVPIELEADKLPDNMNLVLTSTKALGFP